MAKKKPRGPKGAIKHQPGRGHDRKSSTSRKQRYAAKRRRERAAEKGELLSRWLLWDMLTDEQRKLLPELKPDQPRPEDEAEGASDQATI